MRFGLIDLLFEIFSMAIGVAIVRWAFPSCPLFIAAVIGGTFVFLAVFPPIYRRFRLFPMILPRCPCCMKFQNGFHFTHSWPRVTYRCPTCNGEFVIWCNGKVGHTEIWDRPVLVLKWPYAFGPYKRVETPEPSATPNAGPPTASGHSGVKGPPSVS
jgi:hypothetical protein